eukprot:10530196-Alexandrium_andersonii.AAC.1
MDSLSRLSAELLPLSDSQAPSSVAATLKIRPSTDRMFVTAVTPHARDSRRKLQSERSSVPGRVD